MNIETQGFLTADYSDAQRERRRAERAVYEIRVVRALAVREDAPTMLNRAELVASFWREYIETAQWFDSEKECVVVFALDRKNRLIGYNLVSLGSVSASICHPREVLRPVIVAAGSVFIMAHNHPSGDPVPSSADVQLTRQIREAAKAVDIPILDHVIVGRASVDPMGRGFYSFREAGLI
jgi:DNA repair protein RadC